MYNFDQVIDRKGRYTFKWQKYVDRDVLPLWVADSEFKSAPAILDALAEEVEHGVLGYTHPDDYTPAKKAIKSWLKKQHDWEIELDWIVWTPGVVPAFNFACQGFCKEGDNVLFQEPNYPPLMAAPNIHRLTPVKINSVFEADRWTLDFEQLAEKAKDPATSLLILCNPMNPMGSVLSAEELDKLIDICEQNNVILCSDEIHCDLILNEGEKHIPAGKLSPTAITLMAASKTFNVAGLGTSFAIIPDSKVRTQFQKQMQGVAPWVTKFGMLAVEKAFTECHAWYTELLEYLRDNQRYLEKEINAIPGLSYKASDATFLAWIDCSELAVENVQKWFEDRGVGPSPGRDFGWPDYARINFACPRSYLEQAIERLKG